jgi:hypothetical protein
VHRDAFAAERTRQRQTRMQLAEDDRRSHLKTSS